MQQRAPFLVVKKRAPFFMEVFILMCWVIRKVRNGLIFNQILPTLEDAKRTFKTEFALLLWRAKRRCFPLIEQLLNNNLVQSS